MTTDVLRRIINLHTPRPTRLRRVCVHSGAPLDVDEEQGVRKVRVVVFVVFVDRRAQAAEGQVERHDHDRRHVRREDPGQAHDEEERSAVHEVRAERPPLHDVAVDVDDGGGIVAAPVAVADDDGVAGLRGRDVGPLVRPPVARGRTLEQKQAATVVVAPGRGHDDLHEVAEAADVDGDDLRRRVLDDRRLMDTYTRSQL